MYILCTQNRKLDRIRLVNAEHLTVINVDVERLMITAGIIGHNEKITLGKYDTLDECRLAYDTLTETLKARKELFDMDVK